MEPNSSVDRRDRPSPTQGHGSHGDTQPHLASVVSHTGLVQAGPPTSLETLGKSSPIWASVYSPLLPPPRSSRERGSCYYPAG